MIIFLDEIVLSHQERYYYDNYETIEFSQKQWKRDYLKEKQLDRQLKLTNPKQHNNGSFMSNCCTSMDR